MIKKPIPEVWARALYTRHGYEETAPYDGHGKADHWYVMALG